MDEELHPLDGLCSIHFISSVLFRHLSVFGPIRCLLPPFPQVMGKRTDPDHKEYLEPAGIRNMIYSLLASDPVLGYIKALHKSSLSQALHIQKAREAFPGTERAGHEAENWPEGKTELLIALPGREACAPSRAMALSCGLVN